MSTKKIQVIGSLGNKIYVQDDEPTGATTGTMWLDTDEESAGGSSSSSGSGTDGVDGQDGLSIFYSSEALDGKMINLVNLTSINTEGRTVKLGDLLLGSDGSVGQITAVSDTNVSYEILMNIRGENGYTPVRGTDYWTDADKAEIKSYVDEAILGGAW